MMVRSSPSSARAGMRKATALPVGTLALLICLGDVDAQTFTGSTPVRPFTIPGGAPALPTSRSAVDTTRTAPPAATTDPTTGSLGPASTAKIDRLLRLPASASGWRIGGETGELAWPVYITQDETLRKARFRLTYRTDISALPEQSQVVVLVNGTAVGSVEGHAARPRTGLFDVPPGLLQPGFNAVMLRAEQRHRVDCSLPATYELWTEIDPVDSGFVFAPNSDRSILSPADLPALPVRQDGALAIRIVVDAKLQPRDLERAIRAASAVAIASRTLHPAVDFGPLSGEVGINLVVGRAAAVGETWARLAPARVLAPGLAISPATADRAATLFVSGAVDHDVDMAISALAARPALTGSSAGRRLAGLPFGPSTEGQETLSFKAFGLSPQPFEGRRFTVQLPLVLPADFLPADYGQVALSLTGEYGPGVGPKAEVLVRVNDRDAASWPMAKAAGASFSGESLGLSLSLFRPGPNRIEITALLPGNEEGAACSGTADDKPRRRFVLSDQSSLRIPALARVGRSPELAVAVAGGFPTDRPRSLRLVVPQPDRESLAVAATLAAKFATIRKHAPAIMFGRDGASIASGDTVFVAPAQALDLAALATIGADGVAMQRAWRARADQVARARSEPLTTGSAGKARRGGPSACMGEVLRPGRDSVSNRPMTLVRQEIVTDSGSDIRQVSTGNGWSTRIAGFSERLERFARWPIERVIAFLWRPRTAWVAPEADDIAMFAQGRSGEDQFFAITAPSSVDLKLAVECLVSPQTWSEIAGRAVLMRSSDGALRSVPAEDLAYISTQELSLRNVRLVAAGLLSLNPAIFVALALALAAVLTVSTRALVRNVGRKSS